jgi:hypothetical protein
LFQPTIANRGNGKYIALYWTSKSRCNCRRPICNVWYNRFPRILSNILWITHRLWYAGIITARLYFVIFHQILYIFDIFTVVIILLSTIYR